jgi:Fur family ferric uptake transcriptional regulator
VCTQCGEVTCLSQVRVKLTPAPGSTKSVVSSISEIVIKGQCTRCG